MHSNHSTNTINNNSPLPERRPWPRLELSTLYMLSPWTATQGRQRCFHSADAETEAQWSEVICQGHSDKRRQNIPLLFALFLLPLFFLNSWVQGWPYSSN